MSFPTVVNTGRRAGREGDVNCVVSVFIRVRRVDYRLKWTDVSGSNRG